MKNAFAGLVFVACIAVLGAMGAVTVSEPLDVDQWTTEQQTQVRDALVAIVGPQPTDYTTWDYPALKAEVVKIVDEMEKREGVTVSYLKEIRYGTSVVAIDTDIVEEEK